MSQLHVRGLFEVRRLFILRCSLFSPRATAARRSGYKTSGFVPQSSDQLLSSLDVYQAYKASPFHPYYLDFEVSSSFQHPLYCFLADTP